MNLISEGAMEKLIDAVREPGKDDRACSVRGWKFHGLNARLDEERVENESILKLLIIHGIGEQTPRYSGDLVGRIMKRMKFTKKNNKTIIIKLDRLSPENPHAVLYVTTYFKDDKRSANNTTIGETETINQIIIFEVTWSDLLLKSRRSLSYDDGAKFGFKRAKINSLVKQFFNDRVVDPLVYTRNDAVGKAMRHSVEQSMCWMTFGEWDDYIEYDYKQYDNRKQDTKCLWGTPVGPEGRPLKQYNAEFSNLFNKVKNDSYAILTYSLGSQMALDGLAFLSDKIKDPTIDGDELDNLRREMRKKNVTIFMFANQLSLLQVGREIAKNKTGKIDDICNKNSTENGERWLESLSIVAFSDPNDLLSYPVPSDFPDEYIESKFCPRLTNVILNIATEINILNLADPLTAHSDYDKDERVIKLIVDGSHGGIGGVDGEKKNGETKCSVDMEYQ